jgi:hypothetical protein
VLGGRGVTVSRMSTTKTTKVSSALLRPGTAGAWEPPGPAGAHVERCVR